MKVYIVLIEHWDETAILGVYATLESAKASSPNAKWVRSGDCVEMDGLDYGRRVVIEMHDVV